MTRRGLPLSLDPELLKLPTEPYPTLAEQRRLVRERLAKAQADREKFTRAVNYPGLSPEALDLARYMAKMCKIEIILLEKAIAYLGEPDPRLDLYRIFKVNLPPE